MINTPTHASINVDMPLPRRVRVADFNAAFQQAHPSITSATPGPGAEAKRAAAAQAGSMALAVKNRSGERVAVVNADPGDLVEAVMVKIFLLQGIPPDQMRLIFEGRCLDPKRALGECGVASGAELTLILLLCGD